MSKLKLVLFFLFTIHAAIGQIATEAKIYQNCPLGMQMLQAGYMLQNANSTVDGAIAIPDNDIDILVNVGYLRYATFFSVANKPAAVQVMVPFVNVDADVLGFDTNKSGIGDVMVVFGTNIIGGDALAFPQFIQTKKKTVLAWSFAATIPTGRYDENQLINPGGNRWQLKPEIALSIPVNKWDFEAYASAKFFTRNNALPNLFPAGDSSVLEQKAFYGLTLHAVYNFNTQWWISADAAGRVGGETEKDGVKQDDQQSLVGLGATLNYNPSLFHQFGINFMNSSIGNDYAPKGSILNIKYTYVFGGGIRKTLNALNAQEQNNP